MKKILPLLLLSLLFVACNPSESAKNDLQKFTERIEQKSDKWSDAEWDDALAYYSEMCQTIDRYDYSEEELREIGKLKGRCMAKFYKHSFDEGARDVHDAFIELGGAMEELFDAFGK